MPDASFPARLASTVVQAIARDVRNSVPSGQRGYDYGNTQRDRGKGQPL